MKSTTLATSGTYGSTRKSGRGLKGFSRIARQSGVSRLLRFDVKGPFRPFYTQIETDRQDAYLTPERKISRFQHLGQHILKGNDRVVLKGAWSA